MSDDTQTPDPAPADKVEVDLHDLFGVEDTIAVVLAVPNGIEVEGHLNMVPKLYRTTLTAVMAAQTILEDGPVVDTAGAIARATDRIATLVEDPKLGAAIALHLAEAGLLVTGH